MNAFLWKLGEGEDKRWRRLRTDITRMGRGPSGWLIKFRKYQTRRGVDLLLGKPCLFAELNHLVSICCLKNMADNGSVCRQSPELGDGQSCPETNSKTMKPVNPRISGFPKRYALIMYKWSIQRERSLSWWITSFDFFWINPKHLHTSF